MSQWSFSHVLNYIVLVEVCCQYINLHYSHILISVVINGSTRWKWLPLEVNGASKGSAHAFDAAIILSWLKPSKKHSFEIEAVRRNVFFCTNTEITVGVYKHSHSTAFQLTCGVTLFPYIWRSCFLVLVPTSFILL